MSTIFTKIRNGEIPGDFVWKDEHCFAIADINPHSKGHILLIPNQEINAFWEADDYLSTHLNKIAKILAKAQLKTFKSERICQLIIGFDVPHLHIHLVPADNATVLNKSANISPEEIADGAKMIRHTLAEMGYPISE